MSKEKLRAEVLLILFATHPEVNTFFLTSDNQAFFRSHDARNHARDLEDKTVDEVPREGESKAVDPDPGKTLSEQDFEAGKIVPVVPPVAPEAVVPEAPAVEPEAPEVLVELAQETPVQEAEKAPVVLAVDAKEERKEWAAKYMELHGKKAPNFLSLEKIKEAIAAKEAGQ